MQKKKTTSSEELYGELGHAFNFTRGDLEANRAGFMSHRQKQLQKLRLKNQLKDGFAILLCLGVFLFLLTFIAYSKSNCSNCLPFMELGQIVPPFLIVSGLCLFPFLLMIILPLTIDFFDKKTVRVQKLNDKIADKLTGTGASLNYYYDGQRFRMNRAQFSALWSKSNSYTVYYLPNSKEIISVEESPQE